MLDLRFIGVDDLGAHLLFSDEEGNHFRVPLNESLQGAVRRERPRPGRLPVDASAALRPKEVQAMIRAGLTADEVAERAGWPVEKVHRYEGPILGERVYVAGLARQVRLRPRGGTHGSAPTLEERVTERMRSREIEPATASWDSFRVPTGRWSVVVLFSAGGRQRRADWEFDPLARTVSANDDEARWLSEDEDVPTRGPIPAPHLQPPVRPTQVYDVEAEGGVAAPEKRHRAEPADLMTAMRERSSQRSRRRRSKATDPPGIDQVPGEALPLEELVMGPPEAAGDPPPAHERDTDPPVEQTEPTGSDTATDEAAPTGPMVDEPLPLDELMPTTPATRPGEAATSAPEPTEAEQPREPEHPTAVEVTPESTDQMVPVVVAGPVEVSDPVPRPGSESVAQPPGGPQSDAADDRPDVAVEGVVDAPTPAAPAQEKAPPGKAAPRKSGRPSVPSWDDIMFGRKTD